MKQKKKHKKIRFKALIIFFLIIYLIVMTVYYVLQMPVKNIVINGNVLIKENEIIDVINIDEHTPVFKVNNHSLKKKIKNNLLLVNDCHIKKSIFGKITINIEESKLLFLNALENKIVLSNGNMIEEDNKYYGIPILVNYVPSDIIKPFIAGFSKIDSDIIAMISEIEYSPDTYNDTVIDDERFILRMNDGNKVYVNTVNIEKLNKYQTIYATVGSGGILYLDSSSKNYIFRTKEDNPDREVKSEE